MHLNVLLFRDLLQFTSSLDDQVKLTDEKKSHRRFWILGSTCCGRSPVARSRESPPSPCSPWTATPWPPCLSRSLNLHPLTSSSSSSNLQEQIFARLSTSSPLSSSPSTSSTSSCSPSSSSPSSIFQVFAHLNTSLRGLSLGGRCGELPKKL